MANFIASGGVSAAVVIIFYLTYKACERKKFKSTCCGGSIEVKADVPSPSLRSEHSYANASASPQQSRQNLEEKPDLTVRKPELEV